MRNKPSPPRWRMDSNHLNEHLWRNIKEPAGRRLMRLLVKYADPRTGIVSADDMKKVEREFLLGTGD